MSAADNSAPVHLVDTRTGQVHRGPVDSEAHLGLLGASDDMMIGDGEEADNPQAVAGESAEPRQSSGGEIP